jgi:hypothetical protein
MRAIGYQLGSQHPGMQGTQVARVAHTWKGVRVFGAESVVVLDGGGRIVSESASGAPRRLAAARRPRSGRRSWPAGDVRCDPAIPPEAAIEAALASLKPCAGE